MKSRKKKTVPVRAKRYKKKLDKNLDYNDLEARHLLAADLAPAINFAGSTDLIVLNNSVPVTEGVDLLRAQLQLGENETLMLDTMSSDRFGFEHFEYQQYFDGIRLEGSNYTLHVRDSRIVSMSGDRVELVNPTVGTQITNQAAHQFAMDHIGSENYAWQDAFHAELLGLDGAPEGELVYITADDGTSIPTFKFDMYALDLGTRDYVFVNANTGAIEATESRIRNVDVPADGESVYNGLVSFTADEVSSSEFRLRQVTDGVETFDNQQGAPGNFGNAIDITASSPLFDAPIHFSGVSAHWGAENVLSMLEDLFGRDSYDDMGSTLTSYVNVNFFNASWNGSVMQYGEGNGSTFGPLVEIDIVGHEIFHGVTEFSSNLVYQNEPGALNESFSDIFGEVVENYATGTNDWLSGANADLQGDGIRSFIDPNSDGQPDTYLGDLWFTGGGDNGGVHFNSGVQNKWFYILSVGESGTNDNGDFYDVTGIGIDDAAQIAYRSNNVYLGVNSQYQDAREAAVQAAADIFGPGSPQRQATGAAWTAVGVYSDDIEINAMTEVLPGSMIFVTEESGDIPAGQARNVLIPLDAGQTLSVVVEGKNGVAPTITITDPNSTIIATAGSNGFVSSVDTVPVATSGQYLIEVGSSSGVFGDFDIRVILNASLEGETLQTFDNGQQSTAQNIENSVMDLPAISADRLGVLGEFEISEIPFFAAEGFESGVLDGSWNVSSSTPEGRIQVLDSLPAGEGDFALFMHNSVSGFENLNEAIWTVDLSSIDAPFLNFYAASWNDENTVLPASFNGTYNGDGVSVSEDGITWHTVLTDAITEAGEWHQYSVNLDDLATNVGIDLNSSFQIKFQQYDDDLLGADGRAYDGISITTTTQSEDWYSFDLQAGEVATIVVGQSSGAGFVNLELYDSNGALIAPGTPSSEVEGRVSQFVAAATDTYFARLVGSVTDYGLVVTRGTDFDIGSTETIPQDLTLPQSVIGHIDTVTGGVADPDAAADKQILDNFFDGVTLSNNVTGGSVYAVRTSFEAPSGINVFGPTPTGASGWQGSVNEIRADFAIPQDFVSILVGAEESEEDVGFLRAYDVNGTLVDSVISRPLEPGETQTIWVRSATREIAYVVAGGFQNDVTPLDRLTYDVALEASDHYSFDLEPNAILEANATFPGATSFLFRNGLVDGGNILFQMELIDPNGQVVASGEDSLSYYSVDGGTHMIRVTAIGGDGDYQIGITGEVQADRFNLGSLNWGVAVDDFATGNGYLMYSDESLLTRFAANPVWPNNAEHVIGVRFESGEWQYSDNHNWHAFTPSEGDRLIAVINFDTDRIDSLEGLSGVIHGIYQGFANSDIQFETNAWNGSYNDGEFGLTGTHFNTGDQIVDVGELGRGVAAEDSLTGTGFMMYSEESVHTRFAANLPNPFNSPHVITVRLNGNWQYNDNYSWHDFTPEPTDRLLASINFAKDEVVSLNGKSGSISGMAFGVVDSDIEFTPNQWNGGYNLGEFGFTGSQFIANQVNFDMGDTGRGIGVHDSATGTGQILYSQENVFTRFAGQPPRTFGAEQMVAVRYDSGSSSWQYSDNVGWVNFTPVASDRLIANVDYDADTITPIEGYGGKVNGINQGFFDSDLVMTANMWDGASDPGEFTVTGTYFNTSTNSYDIGTLGRGIAVDDAATGTGFLMYSDFSLRDRFSANPVHNFTSDSLIAVRFESGMWQYNDNYVWHVFTPLVNDRLIAALDFDANTVDSLLGVSGSYEGIAQGFFESDLTFVAESWNGSFNEGEFQVFGTSFTG